MMTSKGSADNVTSLSDILAVKWYHRSLNIAGHNDTSLRAAKLWTVIDRQLVMSPCCDTVSRTERNNVPSFALWRICSAYAVYVKCRCYISDQGYGLIFNARGMLNVGLGESPVIVKWLQDFFYSSTKISWNSVTKMGIKQYAMSRCYCTVDVCCTF